MAFTKNKKKLWIKRLWNFFYGLILIVLAVIAVAVALSALDIPGGYKLYTVQSGSMAPAIPTGSLVISKPDGDYKVGDVITFKAEKERFVKNPKLTTTHRIYEVKEKDQEISFVTKGDANESPDVESVDKSLVLGRSIFSIPLLGYPVSFAKTKEGLIILVVIPATIIIWSELISIKNEARKLIAERRKRKLTAKEKLEVKIGKEEIATEKGIKKFFKNIAAKFSK